MLVYQQEKQFNNGLLILKIKQCRYGKANKSKMARLLVRKNLNILIYYEYIIQIT